jgi:hypothetical protein
MKKVLFLLPLLLVLATSCNKQGTSSQNPNTVQNTSGTKVVSSGEASFSGAIQSINNQLPVDGNLTAKVGDKTVILQNGGLTPSGTQPPSGQIIGLDLTGDLNTYVGKKAEVYGRVVTGYKDAVTIVGSTKYYLKITN